MRVYNNNVPHVTLSSSGLVTVVGNSLPNLLMDKLALVVPGKLSSRRHDL